MGTYTSNYNLFMPTVGEQGWGELVNNNFSTIDTTMSGLNTRVGTLETETDAIEERVTTNEGKITTLEAGEFETINCTGYITANGFSGRLYVDSEYTTEEGDYVYSTLAAQSVAGAKNASTPLLTVSSNFVKNSEITFPLKISPGVYIPDESLIRGDYEAVKSSLFPITTTYSINAKSGRGTVTIYIDNVAVKSQFVNGNTFTFTYDLYPGQTTYMGFSNSGDITYLTISIPEKKIYVTTN